MKPRGTIALFLPNLGGGGAERAFVNLACGLVERDERVDLVLRKAEGPYLPLVPPSVRIVDLNAPSLIAGLPRLIRYLRRAQPEVLISTMPHTNVVAYIAVRLARVRLRLVLNEQCHLSAWLPSSTRLKDRLLLPLIRWCYPRAEAIVALSQGVADDLAQMLPGARRISVIHNPVVTPTLHALAHEPLDHPWFVKGQPPVLLAVGRLTAQKDFPTLLQAFALLRQRREVRLVILGEGEDRPLLEALIRQLHLQTDVSLPGFVSNPYKYMSRAALLVLSSRYEGLGMVIVEALAVGTPVVATDCPSGPSEMLRGGQDGRLVPVGDVEALADAMEATLDERPNRRSLQARASSFATDVVVDQYLRIIRPNMADASLQQALGLG